MGGKTYDRSSSLIDNTFNAPSWEESLKVYKDTKQNRPFPDDHYRAPQRVTRYAKSREECAYHPILQTFTDDRKEVVIRENETDFRTTQLNAARDIQLQRESPFDIISQRNKQAGLDDPRNKVEAIQVPEDSKGLQVLRHPLDSCYQYNIISNISLADHHWAPPELRPKVEDETAADKVRLQTVHALPREFNVISNKYVENDNEKRQLEYNMKKRQAAEKFWQTHDYDPFTCTYYDPKKEEAYRDSVEAAKEAQPMKQFNRLPPSMQKGEGYVYSITNHTVKNANLYEKKKQDEQRWLEVKSRRYTREAEIKKTMESQQQMEEERTTARMSHQRYLDSMAHGFNIINNSSYLNHEAAVAPARTRPKPTPWQKCTLNSMSSYDRLPDSLDLLPPPSLGSGASSKRSLSRPASDPGTQTQDIGNTASAARGGIDIETIESRPPSLASSLGSSFAGPPAANKVRTGGFQRISE